MEREDSCDTIHNIGPRAFVGGNGRYWQTISKLQYKFLIERGLQPSDVLIDIGCGCLRGGVRFIRYLDEGHYLGIDKSIELIIYGVVDELGRALFRAKRPRFIVSSEFEFERFGCCPTFGIAQSLFTHLTRDDIMRCLKELRDNVAPSGCRLFATFHEIGEPIENPERSHSWRQFRYTIQEMRQFGAAARWDFSYVGDWRHPRGQKMVEYIAPPSEFRL